MADIQAQNIFDTIRVPLFGGMQRSPDASWTNGSMDEIMINCFPQSAINPVSGEKESWITKRPGLELVSTTMVATTGAISSIGMDNIGINALNDVYVCALHDTTNSKIWILQYRPVTATVTKIGEIAGAAHGDQCFLTELTVANVATLGVIWNSVDGVTSKGYYATSSGGVFTAASLTEITDVDFPPKAASPLPLVGPMVQMNGTTYVLTNTGEIHGSVTNTISNWNSLNLVQAISFPDQGVGLFRYKNYILAFGENSIEWFSDVGNPEPVSPLKRQEQAFIKMGALHANAITIVDDSVYWLGRSSSGSTGLWKMDGFTPVKLTGPAEDQILEYPATTSGKYGDHKLSALHLLGQKHIIIGGAVFRAGLPCSATIASDTRGYSSATTVNQGLLTYSIAEQKFWGWRAAVGSSNFQTEHFPLATSQYRLNNTSASTQYMIICGGIPTRNYGAYIYRMPVDSHYWSDKDFASTQVPYPVIWQPNRIMLGNARRKRIHKIKFIFDYLFSNSSDSDSGSMLWFFWGNDRSYAESTNTQSRQITIPNTFGRYFVANCGSSRTLSIGFGTMNKMAMRLRAVELDVSQGSQ